MLKLFNVMPEIDLQTDRVSLLLLLDIGKFNRTLILFISKIALISINHSYNIVMPYVVSVIIKQRKAVADPGIAGGGYRC